MKQIILMLIATLLLPLAARAQQQKRPNIVLIISDDQRWDSIGASGNPHVITPNIDQLAREGTYFCQATISTPQCTPSRASLLTGVYPHTHGKYSNQDYRPEVKTGEGFKLPMLPAQLSANGYRTVLVGKWHLFNDPWNCGFTDVRVWLPGGSGPKKDPKLAQGESRDVKTIEGFSTEIFASSTIQFLKSEAAKEKPFFIWHADILTHAPLQPVPERISKLYGDKKTEDLLPPGFPKDIPTHNFRRYYECATHLDEQVGRIVETLKEQKLWENTIVTYLGDNGFMMGSRGIGAKGAAGKVVPYEESVRVPFVMRIPQGFKATSDAPVNSIDLPVTLVKQAGIAVPTEWPGRDLTRLLATGKDESVGEAFVEFADNKSEEFGKVAYRLVRTRSHKLIVWDDPARKPELYDLVRDPREETNLYDQPEAADVQNDLKARLAAWLTKTGDSEFAERHK